MERRLERYQKTGKLGTTLPEVHKEVVYDFLPGLQSGKGIVVDKVEGFTIDTNSIGMPLLITTALMTAPVKRSSLK